MKRTYTAILILSIFSLSAMDDKNKPEWLKNLENCIAMNTTALQNLSNRLAAIEALVMPIKQPKTPEIKPSTPLEIKPAINQGIKPLFLYQPTPSQICNSFTDMCFNLKYDDVAKNYKVIFGFKNYFQHDFKDYKKTIQDAYNDMASKEREQIAVNDPALKLYSYISYIKSNSTDLQKVDKNLQEIVKHDAAIMDAFDTENMQELSKLLDERQAKLASNVIFRITANQLLRRAVREKSKNLCSNLGYNK